MPPEPMPIIAWTIWKPVPCASCHGWRNAKKRARRYGSSQIAIVPSAPAIAIAANERAPRRAGDDAASPSSITMSAIAVPMSGSRISSTQKTDGERADGAPELAQVARRRAA